MNEKTYIDEVQSLSENREKILKSNLIDFLKSNINDIGLTSYAFLSQIYSSQQYGPLIEKKIIQLFEDEKYGWKKFNRSTNETLINRNNKVPTGDAIDKKNNIIEIKTSFYHDGSKSFSNFVQMREESVDYFMLLSFNFEKLNKINSLLSNEEFNVFDIKENFKDIVRVAYFPSELLNEILQDAEINAGKSHSDAASKRLSLNYQELTLFIQSIKNILSKPENKEHLDHCKNIYLKIKNELLDSNKNFIDLLYQRNFITKENLNNYLLENKTNIKTQIKESLSDFINDNYENILKYNKKLKSSYLLDIEKSPNSKNQKRFLKETRQILFSNILNSINKNGSFNKKNIPLILNQIYEKHLILNTPLEKILENNKDLIKSIKKPHKNKVQIEIIE